MYATIHHHNAAVLASYLAYICQDPTTVDQASVDTYNKASEAAEDAYNNDPAV